MTALPLVSAVASFLPPWVPVWEATPATPYWGVIVLAKSPTDPTLPVGQSQLPPFGHPVCNPAHLWCRSAKLSPVPVYLNFRASVSAWLSHTQQRSTISLRCRTIQMSAQSTTVMASNKSVTYQAESCNVAHVSEGFDDQCFQCYCENRWILSFLSGHLIKLTSAVRQPTW